MGKIDPAANSPSKPATKKRDTVDLLIDGFNERPDRPRILPSDTKDFTPTPPPPAVRAKAFNEDERAKTRRIRNFITGALVGFLLVFGLGILVLHR